MKNFVFLISTLAVCGMSGCAPQSSGTSGDFSWIPGGDPPPYIPPVGPTDPARPGFIENPDGKPVDVRGIPSGAVIPDPYSPGRTIRVP